MVWHTPKRKNKRSVNQNLPESIPKWVRYWYLCRYLPTLRPRPRCLDWFDGPTASIAPNAKSRIISKDVASTRNTCKDTIAKPGSTVYTDEYKAYNSLEKIGYDHHTVNHSEGEYASGEDNEIHTNNCECLVGLLKWWWVKRLHLGVTV